MIAIGLIAVGRETFISVTVARPAVFDLEEAVQFVSDGLADGPASRLTPADLRWILLTDIEQIEQATDHAEDLGRGRGLLDEDAAVQAVLAHPDADERGLRAEDVAAVLEGRSAYLVAIGAIGPLAAEPDSPAEPPA